MFIPTAQILQSAPIAVGYGESLPVSPANGDEYILVDDDTNPSWQLRFRYNANSSSGFKWEYVGGTGIYIEVATDESTASTSYTALTTPGPSITLPNAGDWFVSVGSTSYNAGASMRHSYDIGASAAVDANATVGNNASAVLGNSCERTVKHTGLTAVALVSKYKTSAGTARFLLRWMRVEPIRVS